MQRVYVCPVCARKQFTQKTCPPCKQIRALIARARRGSSAPQDMPPDPAREARIELYARLADQRLPLFARKRGVPS